MTEDEIKQYALYELGAEDAIVFSPEIDATSKSAKRMNFIYESVIKATLARYRWGFALRRVQLSGQTPLTDERYDYSYDIPADFLFLRNQYTDERASGVIVDYEIIDGKFHTNRTEVWIDYTYRALEAQFPDYFIEFLKYKLAFDLCFNLTGDTTLLQVLAAREKFEYVNATNIDARQQKTRILRDAPFIDARGNGRNTRSIKAV